jgi:hypothetical protein
MLRGEQKVLEGNECPFWTRDESIPKTVTDDFKRNKHNFFKSTKVPGDPV